ncbi:hypothetical protein [Streptomyces glycanivorans]|uniref:Uncharacterized protein n=1 Tax=Streptomyces glycanivorans TaxID=3033808 RepID=A0ABY9JB89_9ACTN|nr:hypothetical protein [Streptomyces sp. Alt3]WLQ63372.1 hypothetical protein P8A20_07070 [Streptomyces sp. Alt3]
MTTTVPTAADARELYDFLSRRVDEEHTAALADETLEGEAQARYFRLSNASKYGLPGTVESVSYLLAQGDTEGVTRVWHLLTGAGEQWRDHADYLPAWQNPQLASIRQALEG